MQRPFAPPRPPAPPYAPGPNASGTATVALSAPPADLTPAGPLAMASAACTTRSACPHLCMSTPGGPTSLTSMSTFMTMPASLRGSGDTGDTGVLPTANDILLNGPSRAQTLICPYSAAPRMGEPFGGCASAGVVSHEYPLFVTITYRHCFAPPCVKVPRP